MVVMKIFVRVNLVLNRLVYMIVELLFFEYGLVIFLDLFEFYYVSVRDFY